MPPIASANKRIRLLAVDDEAEILQLYQVLFSPQPDLMEGFPLTIEAEPPPISADPAQPSEYQLDVVSQGGIAIEKVRRAVESATPYAVAFIDMRMPPGIDGLETALAIRALDPEIQIFIISAYADYSVEQIEQALHYGVLFLKKPIASDEIRQFTQQSVTQWQRTYEINQLKQRLEASILSQKSLCWTYTMADHRFAPSDNWSLLIGASSTNPTPYDNDFLDHIHPDDHHIFQPSTLPEHGFISLTHRLLSDHRNDQWCHTLAQFKTMRGGEQRYIVGITLPISGGREPKVMSAGAAHDFQRLEQLTTRNKLSAAANNLLMRQMIQKLLNASRPFYLLQLHVEGIERVIAQAGESAGEQAILDCFHRLEPLLPHNHQTFIAEQNRWVVCLFSNASKEAAEALAKKVSAALTFHYAPAMVKSWINATVEHYHYPEERAQIEAIGFEQSLS